MAKTYGGRWKIVSTISAGGQGDVYRVTDKTGELNGQWAMKRLRRKDRIGRFRQEVEILRRLQHENIITLVDAQVVEKGGDDASFLVMPIAQCGDLDSRLSIYRGTSTASSMLPRRSRGRLNMHTRPKSSIAT